MPRQGHAPAALTNGRRIPANRWARGPVLLVLLLGLFTAAAPAAAGRRIGTLTATPAAGPAGTVFRLQGHGFPLDWATGQLELSVRPAPPAAPVPATTDTSIRVVVDASGTFQATLDSTGLAPGRYTVFVWSQLSPDDVITETTITVTSSSGPALPATGGGGMAGRTQRGARGLGVGAGAIALSVVVYLVRRQLRREQGW